MYHSWDYYKYADGREGQHKVKEWETILFFVGENEQKEKGHQSATFNYFLISQARCL